jgi:hypothetical protein
MFIGRSRFVILVQIGNPTWLPGPIMCSDWLNLRKSSCQKLLSQWNCNIPDIIKYDIHLYHSYLSAFFISAGVPNGEFPETLIAKCRSKFYCTGFFSQAEDFESCLPNLLFLCQSHIQDGLHRATIVYHCIHVNLPAGAFFSRF